MEEERQRVEAVCTSQLATCPIIVIGQVPVPLDFVPFLEILCGNISPILADIGFTT